MFQFHSGTIKARQGRSGRSYPGSFQFHSGTIKAMLRLPFRKPTAGFQFHSGTIKAVWIGINEGVIFQFQFHSGTIKAARLRMMPSWKPYFNSTLVRLRLSDAVKTYLGYERFNSTLVRLRLYGGQIIRSNTIVFQFHSGTIKACQFSRYSEYHLRFNSTLVRLRL